MKQIVAIVKPFLAEKVINAISDQTVEEISVREVKGFGRQKNYLDQYGDNEYSLAFVPKVEISIWSEDQHVDSIIDCVVAVSRTGRLGDGKIMVLPVLDSLNFSQE
ncbi:MAG: P-II family nitrogen regulator [Mariniblastus sp.]|nr:P-II family nitrogen regulator [Mariniblastus sp.]